MTSSPARSIRTTVTLTGRAAQLVDELASRVPTATATATNEAVGILVDLLDAETRRQRWTLSQLGLVAEVLNGTLLGAGVGAVAAGEVADALALDDEHAADGLPGDGLAARWGVDGAALVDRLARLGPAADLALRLAVARWWARLGVHTPEGWAAVGLTVVDG